MSFIFNRLLLVVVLFSFGFSSFSQTVIRGKIKDKETGAPIAGVKIGIDSQGIGVLSNASGTFAYKKYEEVLQEDDRLNIVASGYAPLVLTADEVRDVWNSYPTFYLEKGKTGDSKNKGKLNARLFWDASKEMEDRNLEEGLTQLKSFLSKNYVEDLEIVVYNKVVVKKQEFASPLGKLNEIEVFLKDVTYSGISNYEIIDNTTSDVTILSTNGYGVLGTPKISSSQAVYVISSSKVQGNTSWINDLVDYTDGAILKTDIAIDNTVSSNTKAITYKGQVVYKGKGLEGASIILENSLDEYITDTNGNFELTAQEGQNIIVGHVRMQTKKATLLGDPPFQVKMELASNLLDEVVLYGDKREKVIVGGKVFRGKDGFFNAEDEYITADQIDPNADYIGDVLRAAFNSIRYQFTSNGMSYTVNGSYPAWFIDNTLYRDGVPSHLQAKDILSIVVKGNPLKTNMYGAYVEGVAVYITTKPEVTAKDLLVKNNTYTEEVRLINDGYSSLLISGTVTSPNGPVQGAEVINKNSLDIVYTKANGRYALPGDIGDVIIINSLGMFSKELLFEGNKNIDVELLPNSDLLDEVVLTGNTRTIIPEVAGPIYATGQYKIGKNRYDVTTLTRKNFNFDHFTDITSGLSGKISSVQKIKNTITVRGDVPLFFIDGQPADALQFEVLNPSLIESISVKKSLGPVEGYQGRAIFVNTKRFVDPAFKPKDLRVKNNAYTEDIAVLSKEKNTSFVSGVVSGPSGAIQGVTITAKGSFDEYRTDASGAFRVPATEGDVLNFYYLGMYPKAHRIDNTEELLEIQLVSKNELLDEVVVAGKGKSETEKETLITAFGKENKNKVGYSVNNITSKDIAPSAIYLADVIRGKFAGVDVQGFGVDARFTIRSGSTTLGGAGTGGPVWVIDNVIYTTTPNFIDPNDIETLSILKSSIAANRYGTVAIDGAFVITTKRSGGEFEKKPENKFLLKGNEYTEESLASLDSKKELPSYLRKIISVPSINERFETYKSLAPNYSSNVEFFVDMAIYFSKLDTSKTQQILTDLTSLGKNNVKVLRTVGYIYEYIDDPANALLIYKRVLKLQPSASQSYRDVAHAYVTTGFYNKALELYMNMLGDQIKGVDFSGIENTLRRELSHLVARHKDKIAYERLPNVWLDANFKIDVRLVLEWSEGSAPFEFQFVNPQKKYYKWSHTLEDSKERLFEEEKQGFQTEEFVIDDAPPGEWLVNIQYLGSESDYTIPPFLKYTVYKNYGTAEETKQVRVVKLFRQIDKVTLGKVNL